MAFNAGTRLGPYEILAPIGAGGMGEVYRARDTKLDRDVAIKVIPPALAQDPERLARFEREAKVLASLNHPNIAQIYGVEDRALVMELVAGETLQGPLPLETALHLHSQGRLDAGERHIQAILHRHGPCIRKANKLEPSVHFLDQSVVGHSRPPLFARLERDRRIVHIERCVISGAIGTTYRPEYTFDLRKRKLARQGHGVAWEFDGPRGAYTGRMLIDGEIFTPSEATKEFFQKQK
jgi:hypothetical protein